MNSSMSGIEDDDEPSLATVTRHNVRVLPVGLWQRILVRVCVSVFVAVLAGIKAVRFVPSTIVSETDIAGYPAAFGFDSLRLRNIYLLWILAVPLLAFVVYVLLPKVLPVLRPDEDLPFVEISSTDSGTDVPHVSLGAARVRATFVGLVLGLEASIVSSRWQWSPGLLIIAGAAGGLLAALVAQAFCRRLNRSASTVISFLTILGGIASIPGLYAVSRSTWVTVAEDGSRRFFPWLPAGVTLFLTAIVACSVIISWRRSGPAMAERRLVIFGVGTIAVFMVTAALPGLVAPPDFFHHGEQLGGAELFRSGAVPWRDYLFIHGLTYDSLFHAFGGSLLGDTYWSLVAIETLVILPLTLAGFYIFSALLLDHNPVLLTVIAASLCLGGSVMGGLASTVAVRMVLYPFALCLALIFLRKPTILRGVLFGVLFFCLVIGTPDAAFLLFGMPIAIVGADLNGWRRPEPIWPRLRRTKIFVVAGLGLSVLLGVILASAGALGDFIYTIATFADHHELTGAIPFQWGGFTYAVAAYGVPALIVLTFANVTWRLRSRRGMSLEDWTGLGIAIMLIPYYLRFLYRADGHVFLPWSMALPLIILLVVRAADLAETVLNAVGLATKGLTTRSLIAASVALVLFFPWLPAWNAGWSRGTSLASRFQPLSPTAPVASKFGFVNHSGTTDSQIPDLEALLKPISARPLSVFDFTNQPGLYYYFLGLKSPTRYFHVSMAIREKNQANLITELASTPPDVVVYDSLNGGLPSWDFLPNIVRHYDVSEWILRRYKPWLQIHGQTFLVRNDLDLPTTSAALPPLSTPITPQPDIAESWPECSWHQLGERLSDRSQAGGIVLETDPVDAMVSVTGWVAADNRTARRVYAIVDGRIVASIRPEDKRPDVSSSLGLATDAALGFRLLVPLVRGGSRQVAMLAEWSDGSLSVIAPNGSTAISSTDRPTSVVLNGASRTIDSADAGVVESAALQAAADDGTVQIVGGTRHLVDRIAVPADRTSQSWLKLSSSGDEIDPDKFQLTDTLSNTAGIVSFDATLKDKSVSIQIASCPMWFGQRADFLYLIHERNRGALQIEVSKGSTPN
jgi:hypothetical protein